MATPEESSPRCLLLAPFGTEVDDLYRTVKSAAEECGFRLAPFTDPARLAVPDAVFSEIVKADLVMALVSHASAQLFYEVGLTHASGKPVVFLVDEEAGTPFEARFFAARWFSQRQVLGYNHSGGGLGQLKSRLQGLLEDFKRDPLPFRVFPNLPTQRAPLPTIDLDRVEPRELENLCFELLTQMGFKRVEWGKELSEVDLVATLPRKDPDGFEYNELWLITTGLHVPFEMLVELIMEEPDHLAHRLRHSGFMEKSRTDPRQDTPITLLLILLGDRPSTDRLRHELSRIEQRYAERRFPFALRVRLWGRQQLVSLIQQYPQIAYKYFSEEARSQSKHRKTLEEVYRENVELTKKLQAVNEQLQSTTTALKRAERDAVWKEVAFKAAHKLGNPIFALETDLQGIKRRLETQPDQALKVALEMGSSIEKAKTIIEQFKSLTRAHEISARPVDLAPLIKSAAHVAEENGVQVRIAGEQDHLHVFADPTRMTECFDELFANALHWLDKAEKRINVTIGSAKKEGLPPGLDRAIQYVRIVFEDNGSGIPLDKKEEIFAPFFTTYPHGTGLGLSLVQRVIEGHGGLIREVGKPGKGAIFELFLPQAAPGSKGVELCPTFS